MKKNQFIKVSAFLFAVALSSSAMVVQTKAITPKKQMTANKAVVQDAKEDEARAAVEDLFTDDTHTVVKDDVTRDDIDNARALVNNLPAGGVKNYLLYLVNMAQHYYYIQEASKVVYPLYRDDEHTYIREDLTRDEINYAFRVVYGLGANIDAGRLLILVIIAERQFDSREATFTLFTDDTHTVIRADLTQADINKAKELVGTLLDEWAIKGDLYKLVFKAQYQFNPGEATRLVYNLYSDEAHTIIKKDLKLPEIIHARTVVEELAAGPVKVQLRILVIVAQVQFDAREAVYALFSDDTHTKIKADLTQTDINKAKALLDILKDEWPIKAELNQLIILAQDQLDERSPQLIVQPAV